MVTHGPLVAAGWCTRPRTHSDNERLSEYRRGRWERAADLQNRLPRLAPCGSVGDSGSRAHDGSAASGGYLSA
eukprot:1206884-Prymnesium_polylepis.1